jgi:CheY-like chemotaxis protein
VAVHLLGRKKYRSAKMEWGSISQETGTGEAPMGEAFAGETAGGEGLIGASALDAWQCSGKETILLVEDEEFTLEAIREALESAGYTVLIAGCADAAAAQQRGCADALDLLLTDVVMPGKSGHDLANDLVASCPGLRVLLMSGYEQHPGCGKFCAYGMAYMAKPFSTATLLKRVRETLDGKPEVGRASA